MANNVENHVNIKIINNKELLDLFNELQTKYQNKIILDGMKKAGKIYLDAAKNNYKSLKFKNRKSNIAKDFNRSFKQEPIKNPENGFGLKIGVKNYKLRWIDWGTNDRKYKGKKKWHFTGKIEKTNFFANAVKDNKETVMKQVQDMIMESFKKTVEKFNK